MGKRFNAFILAAFFSSLAPCAYGRLLVFGPEFFFSEAGKSQKVTRDFRVHDTNQKFILSIQSGDSSGKGIKATITLNGARVALPDEFREHLMITEPVNLRNKNEIAVETAGEADASLLVTIMSMEEHTATAEIPLLGEAVEFEEGYARVIFPSGSFGAVHSVTITTTASPSTRHLFEANAMVPRLPYEIRINTGDQPPAKDVELSVLVPDSFIASDYAIHIFAQMHDNPDAPDLHDRFFQMSSGLDDIVKMIKTTLPREAFSKLYGKNGTYEAIITVGLIH